MPFFRDGTRRALLWGGGVSAPLLLPRAGPFASLASVPISTLSNATISGGTFIVPSSTYSNPHKYNTYSIDAGSVAQVPVTAGYAFLAWTNHFVMGFDAIVAANGQNGQDGNTGCETGGNGGYGGMGGGGGGGFYQPCCGCGTASGGLGGDVSNLSWDGGNGDSAGTSGGFGGVGSGQSWSGAYPWPNGGNSDSGQIGGPGAGAGGDGGYANSNSVPCPCCGCVFNPEPSGGGGGGGGGKLICIVTNYTSFNAGSSQLDVSGGIGGNPNSGNAGPGYAGGQGAVLIMTKQWSNPPSSILGNIEVWEIKRDLSIVRRLDYASASWNNN